MSIRLSKAHEVVRESEDDFRSVPEILSAIEALGRLGHASSQGLDVDECRGLYRIAITASTLARKNLDLWERLFELTKGGDA